jgi:hypothetical protein
MEAWQRSLAQPGYTHYSSLGASRIDRLYITSDLLQRKRGIETIATALADHLSVSLHLTIDMPLVRWGRGMWKIYTTMLAENIITEEIKTLWGQFQRQKSYFPSIPTWWDRYSKRS